jgi:hypothetical protein
MVLKPFGSETKVTLGLAIAPLDLKPSPWKADRRCVERETKTAEFRTGIYLDD